MAGHLSWAKAARTGDFGTSLTQNVPVWQMVAPRMLSALVASALPEFVATLKGATARIGNAATHFVRWHNPEASASVAEVQVPVPPASGRPDTVLTLRNLAARYGHLKILRDVSSLPVAGGSAHQLVG